VRVKGYALRVSRFRLWNAECRIKKWAYWSGGVMEQWKNSCPLTFCLAFLSHFSDRTSYFIVSVSYIMYLVSFFVLLRALRGLRFDFRHSRQFSAF